MMLISLTHTHSLSLSLSPPTHPSTHLPTQLLTVRHSSLQKTNQGEARAHSLFQIDVDDEERDDRSNELVVKRTRTRSRDEMEQEGDGHVSATKRSTNQSSFDGSITTHSRGKCTGSSENPRILESTLASTALKFDRSRSTNDTKMDEDTKNTVCVCWTEDMSCFSFSLKYVYDCVCKDSFLY